MQPLYVGKADRRLGVTGEERSTIHGNNERIRVDCLCRASDFYLRLIKKC